MKKRKKYIYTSKKHPQSAIMAFVLGVISILSMIIVIYLTYKTGGNTQGGYGVTGLLATIFSLVGFVLGARSLKDKECFKFFPVFGTIINLLVLFGIGFLVYLGQIS